MILVDCSVKYDKRICRSVERIDSASRIINIKSNYSCRNYIVYVSVWLKLILRIFTVYVKTKTERRRLLRMVDSFLPRNPFVGLTACLSRIHEAVRAVVWHNGYSEFTEIYAHDLYCALSGSLGGAQHLTYDAHELEIHRNRKVGHFRLTIEFLLEQTVLSRSKKVLVVNEPIKRLMQEWYSVNTPIIVDYNDHYPQRYISAPDESSEPYIVFVGGSTKGRALEALSHPPECTKFHIRVFPITETEDYFKISRFWSIGSVQYESELISLMKTHRTLMWCCTDRNCLSYLLSTPNKFFQALSLGLPIIAMTGTYLAELSIQYHIGPVFDGSNLDSIYEDTLTDKYLEWVEGARALHSGLNNDSIKL